jgi:hypothetical protein
MLFCSGCAAFDLDIFQAEGALASTVCIKGAALPYGGGIVVGAKVNEGFEGWVVVNADCNVTIESK